ncbi:hypothetical protein LSCM1_02254 [Leishmania martiniquensis]|uniref:Uncharacterized protein n=1 Tax=Leishmania martiniquensis TaxID=1580590 RepID=A0A836KC57_9TRYP|nr:hypothetical protein LSCM1_02254 [Leishmania martiniquensis]
MRSLSDSAARDSESHLQYGERCALLREERYRRSLLCSLEAKGREQLRAVYAEESEGEWTREHARGSATVYTAERRPQLYTYRYRAGATVSVLPVGQSTTSLHERLNAAVDPLNAEMKQLELWESENRAELQEWECSDRQEMAHEVQCILAEQQECDCVVRERACRQVMSGATVLEWASYPCYEGAELLSSSP